MIRQSILKDIPRGYGVIREDFDTHSYFLSLKPFHLLFRFAHWVEESYLELLSFLFWHSGIVDIPEGAVFPPYVFDTRNWHWPRRSSWWYLWFWCRVDGDVRLIRKYNDNRLLAWITGKLGWRVDRSIREYELKNPMLGEEKDE